MIQARPILKYPGSKTTIAPWIVSHLPKMPHYLDPYFGSGAVYWHLDWQPRHIVLNDRSRSIATLFRVIREHGEELAALIEMTPWSRDEYDLSHEYETCSDPIEQARRFLVRVWQAQNGDLTKRVGWCNAGFSGKGSTVSRWHALPDRIICVAERLRNAEIENTDALKLIKRANKPQVLIYADPPYHPEVRTCDLYEHEMTHEDHVALLDALDAHVGPVVLSGYHCSLYDDRLAHWQAIEQRVTAERGNARTEVLWLNKYAQPTQHKFDWKRG